MIDLKKKSDIDEKFRQSIAENLGCAEENLSSVVLPSEFPQLMAKLKRENFSTGDFLSEDFDKRYQNVLNRTLRANLHMHTLYSDGLMSVETLLNQSIQYANSVQENIGKDFPYFIISITDHDDFRGTIEALKIIAANPDRFINIKFVTGIEFSVGLKNPNIVKSPFSADMVAYCVSPFEREIVDFVNNTKQMRYFEAEKIFEELNKLGINDTLENAKKSLNLIKIAGSIGFFGFIRKYLNGKYKENPAFVENKVYIDTLFANKQGLFSPDADKITALVNKHGGYIGYAHPERIHLEKLDYSKISAEKFNTQRENGLYLLLKEAYDNGATILESNYQYTMRHYSPQLFDYIKVTNAFCGDFPQINTGGMDSHRSNIFSHTEDFTEAQLKSLLGR